ncbi:hypothetical protein NC653_015901 [Populus alba x Populus x berolinensis]|uniref:Protein kinase domain-containing protein n=1 Tax=Populus alba x Populus x berolinensis TaxID=444605 RepID=A0AAD6QLL9_9ROSI|nr:hypothetical protein NC653_015901 [Populus alba x Populus x berolinensis]
MNSTPSSRSMCFDHKFSDRSGPSNPLSNAVSPPAPNALHGQSPSSGNSSTLLFVIGGMTVLIILFILVLYFWKFNKPEKLKKFLKKKEETRDFWSGNLQTINYFDFQTLKKATKNFHPANLLSEVKMITSIQQKNLVRLLGCCSDGPQRGYTAPEYAIKGELSEKADIYSFGVLVLEIISSRKNTDLSLPSEMQYLPEYAWKLYERSRVMDLVDPKLLEHGIVEKDPLANLRSPMSRIVAQLTCKVEMVGTPMRPVFLQRSRKNDDNLSWDTISEAFLSPLWTKSPSLPGPQN